MAIIKYQTDASQSVRAQQALTKAQEDYNKSIEETPKKLTRAEKAAKRLAEQADPQERYNKKMERLAEAVNKGGLAQEKAIALTKKYQQQLDRAGDAGKEAFGAKALSSLASYASGFASVTAAVGLLKQGLSEVEQQNQAVADSFFQGLGSVGQLQQISNTKEDFQKNLGFARSLVSRGVFKDVGQASDFTFAATSAGFSDAEKETLAQIGENKLVASEGLVGFGAAVRKVQNLFGGADGISLSAAADKLLATSGGTQADATQTALAVSQFSSASDTLGFDGDESLAALVLAEEKAKNIDEAATQVANLLDAIDKGGLSVNGDFGDTVQAIQQRIDGGETAFGILGNKRAVKGFRAISSQFEQLAAIEAEIGGSAGLAADRNFIDSDPVTASAALKESAEGRLKAKIEATTTERENLFDAVVADLQATAGSEFSRGAIGVGTRLDDWLGLEDEYLRDNLRANRDRLSEGTASRVEQYLERIANATEKQDATTTRQE